MFGFWDPFMPGDALNVTYVKSMLLKILTFLFLSKILKTEIENIEKSVREEKDIREKQVEEVKENVLTQVNHNLG